MPVELDDSYESIYQRAIAHMALGQADEAIELLWRTINRLTRLRPETIQRKENLRRVLATAWVTLVQAYRWEQRYDQAIVACEAVRDHLAAGQGVERRIASLTIEQGKVEEGLQRLRQAVEAEDSFAAWADLGTECAALDRYDEAETSFQSALALAQSNEEAALGNLGLFRLYKETERVDDALSTWGMVVVLDPDRADQVYEVYAWLIARGDYESARKYLDRERDPIRATYYAGLIEWEAGQHDTARAKWRDVLAMDIRQDGADAAAWMEAAVRLDEPQLAVDAVELLNVGDEGLNTEAATTLATAHAMLGQVEEAQMWLQRVVERLQRHWPRLEKIDSSRWDLLQEHVRDPDAVQALSGYFDRD